MDGLKKELRKMKENQKFSFKTLRESVVNSLRILIKPSNKASEVLFEDESTPQMPILTMLDNMLLDNDDKKLCFAYLTNILEFLYRH
jgi:hypothetical protein